MPAGHDDDGANRMRLLRRPSSSSSHAAKLCYDAGPEMLFGDVARPRALPAVQDGAEEGEEGTEDSKLDKASGAATAVLQKIVVLSSKLPKNKKSNSLHKELQELKTRFAAFQKKIAAVSAMDMSPARTKAAKALMKEFNKKGAEFAKASARAKEMCKK